MTLRSRNARKSDDCDLPGDVAFTFRLIGVEGFKPRQAPQPAISAFLRGEPLLPDLIGVPGSWFLTVSDNTDPSRHVALAEVGAHFAGYRRGAVILLPRGSASSDAIVAMSVRTFATVLGYEGCSAGNESSEQSLSDESAPR